MVEKILTSGSKAGWILGFIFLALAVLLGCDAEGNEMKVLSENVITTSNAVVHETWDGGTNSPTSGVSYTFTGLSTQQYTYTLTVRVYATDYYSSSEYVSRVYAGSSTLSTYCNPGVDNGGYYYTCVSSQDVTSDVSSGSLVVRTTATSAVNSYAYNGYYLYVQYTLSKTSRTSDVAWEGGTNSPTSGVSNTFTGLDTSTYSYSLTVEVYATDYYSSYEYVNGIYAGSSTLSTNCNPGIDSGGYYYTCVNNQDVTSAVSSSGSLAVRTYATSSVDCCAYNGYYLYVMYSLATVWTGSTSSASSGISHTFTGLDTFLHTYTVSVQVYAYDFGSSNEYVNLISAGSSTLDSYCNPGVDLGYYYYTCVSSQDVTSAVSSSGSLAVYTRATSYVSSLSVKVILTPTLRAVTQTPTPVPTSQPSSPSGPTSATLEGGTNSPANGLTGTFYGLDTSTYAYTLDMEVYETDFASSYEYVSSIYAGTTALSTFCNPGVDSGGSFYFCVSNQDVTGDVSSGSLTVTTYATSYVNSNPYLGYYFYVRFTLTGTISYTTTLGTWSGGTNSPTTGVSVTYTGLDTSSYTYSLTVKVYANDYSSSYEYVNGIYAGSSTLDTYCNPGVDSGGSYYTCVSSQDVTSDVSSGSLVVRTTATSYVDSYAYQGYVLYVRYTLTSSSTGSGSGGSYYSYDDDYDDDGLSGGIIALIVILCLCFCGSVCFWFFHASKKGDTKIVNSYAPPHDGRGGAGTRSGANASGAGSGSGSGASGGGRTGADVTLVPMVHMEEGSVENNASVSIWKKAQPISPEKQTGSITQEPSNVEMQTRLKEEESARLAAEREALEKQRQAAEKEAKAERLAAERAAAEEAARIQAELDAADNEAAKLAAMLENAKKEADAARLQTKEEAAEEERAREMAEKAAADRRRAEEETARLAAEKQATLQKRQAAERAAAEEAARIQAELDSAAEEKAKLAAKLENANKEADAARRLNEQEAAAELARQKEEQAAAEEAARIQAELDSAAQETAKLAAMLESANNEAERLRVEKNAAEASVKKQVMEQQRQAAERAAAEETAHIQAELDSAAQERAKLTAMLECANKEADRLRAEKQAAEESAKRREAEASLRQAEQQHLMSLQQQQQQPMMMQQQPMMMQQQPMMMQQQPMMMQQQPLMMQQPPVVMQQPQPTPEVAIIPTIGPGVLSNSSEPFGMAGRQY